MHEGRDKRPGKDKRGERQERSQKMDRGLLGRDEKKKEDLIRLIEKALKKPVDRGAQAFCEGPSMNLFWGDSVAAAYQRKGKKTI